MFYLYDMLVVDYNGILQFLLLLFMLGLTFPVKTTASKLIIRSGISIVSYAVLNGIVLNLEYHGVPMPRAVPFYANIILSVLFGILFVKDTLTVGSAQRFSITLYYVSNICLSFVLTTVWLGKILTGLNVFGNALRFGLSYAAGIVLALLYRKVTRGIHAHLSFNFWMINMTAPIAGIIMVQLLEQEMTDKMILPVGVIFLLLNFFIYYLSMRLSEEVNSQISLALANQNLSYQIRQMDNVETMLNSARKARHELKNNYFYIEALLEQDKYDEIRDYLNQVVKPFFVQDELISTGNRFVDMLLTQKVSEARALNIPIVLNVMLPERLGIRQQMLCSLLFNLLDNAIEASVHVEQPDIQITMNERKRYLSIEVRNKIDHSVLKNNRNLETSKKDRFNHGIGMSMIRQVVNLYKGDLNIREEDGYFVTSILLMSDPAEED